MFLRLFLLALLAFAAGAAQAAVRNVCSSGAPHATIGAAITAAGAGDTIRLCPGTYNEAVNVTKANLIFESSTGNRADVVVRHSGATFQLQAPNATIRNMTVVSTGGQAITGAWGGNGSHVFQNLVVTAHDNAIKIGNGGMQTFRNLVVSSAIGNGIETEYNAAGAHVFENVQISSNREGIKLANGGPFSFKSVRITSSDAKGIEISANAIGSHVFESVEVHSQTVGIEVNAGGTMSFKNVKVHSVNGSGIVTSYNAAGTHTFDNIEVNAHSTGIQVGNGGGLTFKDIKITSRTGRGLGVAGNMTAANQFQNLEIVAYGTAVYIENGGRQSFEQAVITGQTGNGIHLTANVDGGHTFDNIKITAVREGLIAVRGATRIRNVEIHSDESEGIRIGNKYAGQFRDIKINAWATGFRIASQDAGEPAHVMSDLDITSREREAVYIARSGKLTITNLKATAKWDSVYLAFDSNGPHEIRNATIVSSGGKGLVAYRGLGILENTTIEAQDMALDASNQYNISITSLRVSSENATAINFNNNSGVGASYDIKNVTVLKAGGSTSDGMYFHTATNTPQVRVDNICVYSAGRHAINFHWNSVNVRVVNSIFKGHGGYGIYMGSNTNYVNHVNNSCFAKAPCAWSSTTNHDFSGNFWEPSVAACGNHNINASSPLASCPIPENVCYSGNIGTPVVPGGFNAFEPAPDTPAGAVIGIIKTKIAGEEFNLDVVAVNTGMNAVEAGFYGDVKVEVLGSLDPGVALDANNCPVTSTTLSTHTLTFDTADNGRKTTAIPKIADVWRNARVRITYPATGTPSVVACSTDNFAIRPKWLVGLEARDATWKTAGTARLLDNSEADGGIVHKAGRPFTLAVTAVNADGSPTANYKGIPTVKSLSHTLPAFCMGNAQPKPPSCMNVDALSTGTWSGNAGTVASQNAVYSEVGSFNLVLEDATFASVDHGDSNASEYTIAQAAPALVGRFVPDHFTLTGPGVEPRFVTFDAACTASRSFTYIGQPFYYESEPEIIITAHNYLGGVTQNYSDELWKLNASSVTQTYTPGTGLETQAPEISNPGLGTAKLVVKGPLTFTRGAPQAPFNAAIALALSVKDDSESEGVIGKPDGMPESAPHLRIPDDDGSSIAFDSGREFRYGRLRLSNNYGSEKLNLPIDVSTQYWDGSKFVANAADNCTRIDSDNVHFVGYTGGLNADNMPQSHVLNDVSMLNGQGKLILQKPTAVSSKGSVEICIDLGPDPVGGFVCSAESMANQPWLQGVWSQQNQNEDPRGRAFFGVYRGGPVIYRREAY